MVKLFSGIGLGSSLGKYHEQMEEQFIIRKVSCPLDLLIYLMYHRWGIESKIETVVTQIHQQISPEGRPQQLNEQQGRILQEGIQAIRDGMTPLLPEVTH
jgi:hypothetical protein